MSVFILFQVIQERKELHAQRQNEPDTSSSIEDVALGWSIILSFYDSLLTQGYVHFIELLQNYCKRYIKKNVLRSFVADF
jgi:hypothetical protein